MENNSKILLTIDDMADRLTVKKSWLYRKTMDKGPGSIPRVRLGKYLRFVESDVMEWLKNNQDSR